MKRTSLTLILIPVILLSACRNVSTVNTADDLRTILESMRRDSTLIAFADSLGVLQLGAGTKCIDPVKHIYLRGERTFLYNEDWGGVLELPEGWFPEDDIIQAELSFHGTQVWSPDSTILISTYASYCGQEINQLEVICENLAQQGFMLSSQEEVRIEIGSEPARCFNVMALGENSIYMGKSVVLEKSSIRYFISLQYDGNEDYERVNQIKSYFERYPLGPEGQIPIGDCLL